MDLATLIESLPITLHRGSLAARISSIVDDSRLATPGSLFIARPGTLSDGRRFIHDAIARGAVAILSSDPLTDLADPASASVSPAPSASPLAVLHADDLHRATIALLKRFHGHPGDRLRLLAVTGTNGKTTTTYIVRHLLAAAGLRCGVIGTVEIDNGQTRRPSQLTTPGIVELTALLAEMVRHGCDACVMETSSHALDQGRVEGLRFAAGLFTNLTGDHLDYHKTMDAYAAAKAKLFESLDERAVAIVNGQDPAHSRMIRDCRAPVITFGIDQPGVTIEARITASTARFTACRLIGPWGEVAVKLPLIGRHNVANVLGAVGIGHGLGIEIECMASAIESCPQPPGRLERVANPGDLPFDVLVDYAHTDDALDNVLKALRPVTTGRLRVLFGCGGDRDRTKRPRMAATAARLADDIVITSDNPRTEDPRSILDEILTGVPAHRRGEVTVEIDRAAAIEQIISTATDGDVILLAGKGHEDYQIIGTQKRPFDDRLVAQAVMNRMTATVATTATAATSSAPATLRSTASTTHAGMRGSS
jgi:UDP-N-acetylmuramoyl-L-alanyl-D-glutamate--2,6-diaminopimelate ligase